MSIPAGLPAWVDRFVADHELWAHIPPCWQEHPGLVAELVVLADWQAMLVGNEETTPDQWAGWFDYLGRMLSRLAASPAARCSVHGHELPMTWDVDGYLALRRSGR